jgi:hypothetical protein
MSMTRVRSLNTKKSGHSKKTLLQSIQNSFRHAYPKSCCLANRRASRVPRPCMHARPFVRSPEPYEWSGALYDRGSAKLTGRAVLTTHNVRCVNAFNAKALLANFKNAAHAMLRRSFCSTSNPIGRSIALCRDDIPSTRLIIVAHKKTDRSRAGLDRSKAEQPGLLTAWQRAMVAAEQQRGW